mmetsp:Transcript_14493/g.33470  ORF Transcript_14493/g.33470 Transcript_14493/m.33470 type:complete len:134 (+) Transcript_14493:48-449(+)
MCELKPWGMVYFLECPYLATKNPCLSPQFAKRACQKKVLIIESFASVNILVFSHRGFGHLHRSFHKISSSLVPSLHELKPARERGGRDCRLRLSWKSLGFTLQRKSEQFTLFRKLGADDTKFVCPTPDFHRLK